MVMYGKKKTGGYGIVDPDELADMILNKVDLVLKKKKKPEFVDRRNARDCAEYVLAKKSLVDGGGTSMKYGGKTVFHISRGSGEGKCTIFFTLSHETSTAKGGAQASDIYVAGLVGVGRHDGDSSNRYYLHWGVGAPFFTGQVIDTSTAKQIFNRPDKNSEKSKRLDIVKYA